MLPQIEIELAGAEAGIEGNNPDPAVADVHSIQWKISNPTVLGSVVEPSPDLVNAFTKHLEEGKSLPYSFGTYAAV